MPSRGGSQGRGWPSFLVPGLLGCLVLGLFLTPGGRLLYGGRAGGDDGQGVGMRVGAGGGTGSSEADELSLLLRGKQTQRAAGVAPHAGGQPASTEGLLRYFAEAHSKVRTPRRQEGSAGNSIGAVCSAET